MHAKIVTPDIVLSASDVILRPTLGVPQTYGRLPFELKIITFEVTELLCFIPFLDIYQIHITCDFDSLGWELQVDKYQGFYDFPAKGCAQLVKCNQ